MEKGRPVKPDELESVIKSEPAQEIPGYVYDAFNEVIKRNYCNYMKTKVLIKDVGKIITEKYGSWNWPLSWLKVENYYEKAGWGVTRYTKYYIFINYK